MNTYTVFIKKVYEVFIKSASPRELALGFTLGTITALLPTFGFSIVLTTLLLFLFPSINKPSAYLALALWNPVLQIPIYLVSFEIGSMIFDAAPIIHYQVEVLNQIHTFTRRLIVGNLIVTSILAVCSYISVYTFSRIYIKHEK